ncbi:hypothetical protein [Dictyobacter formicarum]|nr:hypothetical protein [Dictyobacter formicarum]
MVNTKNRRSYPIRLRAVAYWMLSTLHIGWVSPRRYYDGTQGRNVTDG